MTAVKMTMQMMNTIKWTTIIVTMITASLTDIVMMFTMIALTRMMIMKRDMEESEEQCSHVMFAKDKYDKYDGKIEYIMDGI